LKKHWLGSDYEPWRSSHWIGWGKKSRETPIFFMVKTMGFPDVSGRVSLKPMIFVMSVWWDPISDE
jgi:hypothetical protein